MFVEIINKLLMVVFFVSILNFTRHAYYFIQAMVASTEEIPVKYRITDKSLVLLGISIAYVLSTIFTGITL
jgi:hypothetical protein